MGKINVTETFRDFWQYLAVIGGILLVVHAIYIFVNFDTSGVFRFLTIIELFVGVGTSIVDSWFLYRT